MATSSDRINGRSWGVLSVLCGAIFLEGIDVAMLNVALPSIRDDLGLSTGALSGLVSAYVLGYGGFMLLGGRAADLLGRRRMFLGWMVVFLVFSGLGGLATEGWMLLVARFLTGVAAAFLAPAGLALITGLFPEGPQRTKALGFYAGTGAGGYSLGLVAGGVLASAGWRWVFFAPVIMAAVILVAALVLLRDTEERTARTGSFDIAGALTITGAMLLLAYAVVRLEHGADGLPTTLSVAAAGLVLLALFVAIERRAIDPLVRLAVLRSAALARTNVAALLFLGAFAGFQFLVTLYLQEIRGWSPLQTGLAMLVVGLDTVLAPTLTPWLVGRFGNARVLFVGLGTAGLSYLLFLPVAPDWTYAAMLPSFVLLGLAFALVYGPLTMAATAELDEREHGLAGGLLYTAIQFGTALGISGATAVTVAAGGVGTTLDGIRAGLVLPVAAALLAVVVMAFGLRDRAGTPPTPEPVSVGV
ncbi:MFS transporter [Cryptosporangium aurantiacum]|uniref:Major Facilitator Superfamily protein n=1 Tax=Cryptosporangium aurantiacum TaxID=134849 RepID=A0A1M7RLA9_9ACTN|nr:MFS transporter [Cryptosporangium aurantiacum]SHN46962.1 Major Facilitator Superfamily protein [Cryptosporangium aurantiacum]